MTVSKMTPRDVPEAAALDQRLFSAECWSEQDFYSALEQESQAFFVAREGDRLLGCGGVLCGMEQGDVLTVGVDPALRRGGIGSALLSAMIEEFASRGGEQLFLEVRASNLPARGLYEKFGFVSVGLRKNYYRDPVEDGIVYCLEVQR